jgi:hypothetical protein
MEVSGDLRASATLPPGERTQSRSGDVGEEKNCLLPQEIEPGFLGSSSPYHILVKCSPATIEIRLFAPIRSLGYFTC